jgi:hypothetical protein
MGVRLGPPVIGGLGLSNVDAGDGPLRQVDLTAEDRAPGDRDLAVLDVQDHSPLHGLDEEDHLLRRFVLGFQRERDDLLVERKIVEIHPVVERAGIPPLDETDPRRGQLRKPVSQKLGILRIHELDDRLVCLGPIDLRGIRIQERRVLPPKNQIDVAAEGLPR